MLQYIFLLFHDIQFFWDAPVYAKVEADSALFTRLWGVQNIYNFLSVNNGLLNQTTLKEWDHIQTEKKNPVNR